MKIFSRIVIGFLFILLLFVAVLLASFYQNKSVDDNFNWLSHSEQVLQNSAELQKTVIEFQSSLRGYMITGAGDYNAPFQRFEVSSDSIIALLKNQTIDNPDQEAKLIKVQDSIASWILASKLSINTYNLDLRKNGVDSALRFVADRMVSNRPKRIDRLRIMLTRFDSAEYVLRDNRYKLFLRSRNYSEIVSVSLVLSAIIISIATLILVSVSIRNRIETLSNATRKIAAGDYGFRISDGYNDELKELSDAINTMSASLEDTFNKLRQSNEDLEQFAWISSHDLKEPMRMVAIYAQLIESKYKGRLDDEADEAIGYMVEGVKKMYGLINDLLEYARIGRETNIMENVATEEMFGSAIANLRTLIEEKGAVIAIGPIPEWVKGSKLLLVQLSQNLIHNAIKFNNSVPPQIHISAHKTTANEWLFAVKDNGIGIDEKYKDLVFVMFQQFQDGYDGSGIGLAYCKKIVETHGGKIWHEPNKGPGVTFYFTLPIS